MQNFIQNPYPPPKPPEHEKFIKPKPTWENQSRKIIKIPTQKMSNPETSNPEHELHSSCFSPNQDKPNWLTHSKSISAQKIHTHKLKPLPTTTTITHTTNHNNHKSPPKTHRRSTQHHPPPRVKPKLKQNPRPHTKTQNTQTKSKT